MVPLFDHSKELAAFTHAQFGGSGKRRGGQRERHFDVVRRPTRLHRSPNYPLSETACGLVLPRNRARGRPAVFRPSLGFDVTECLNAALFKDAHIGILGQSSCLL